MQKLLLRVLPEASTADSSAECQHVTAALGCCSTIHIDEHVDETHVDENAHHDKEDAAEDDSSDMG